MKKEKKQDKKQEKKQDKPKKKKLSKHDSNARTFKIVGIVCLAIIILIIAAYVYINSLRNYAYEGVEFTTVQEGKLIFYQTSIPVLVNGNTVVPYNFYLRTVPKQLKKVDFDTLDFQLMENAVMSFEKDFNCDGDAIIAVANLAKLHEVLGIDLIRDENATCDSRYTYLRLQEGDKTSIEKIGENCYILNINNCEILKVTERYMLEMFVRYNEATKNK